MTVCVCHWSTIKSIYQKAWWTSHWHRGNHRWWLRTFYIRNLQIESDFPSKPETKQIIDIISSRTEWNATYRVTHTRTQASTHHVILHVETSTLFGHSVFVVHSSGKFVGARAFYEWNAILSARKRAFQTWSGTLREDYNIRTWQRYFFIFFMWVIISPFFRQNLKLKFDRGS